MGLCGQQSPTQSEAVEGKAKRRKTSYVQSQKSVKNFGMLAKNLECALLKARTAVEREHQSRHQQGPSRQAVMSGLVTGEIA
jgi:hypothetical protein